MPDWVPAPREVILFTGVCEIAGAFGLVTRSFRWWAAVMLAVYAAGVFPANIKHAFENVQLPQLPSSWWYHGPRLTPAGHHLVALYCGRVICWPSRHGPGMSSNGNSLALFRASWVLSERVASQHQRSARYDHKHHEV
jgi:hypothetical protein